MRAKSIRHIAANTRCLDGRLMRHDPQPDDPCLETDIGQCPDCDGAGCEAMREEQMRCKSNKTGFDGECVWCGAWQGEACRDPKR